VLAGNKHRTLHKKQTDETMLPIFKYDTDGKTQQKRPYTLARRNYTSVNFDTEKGLVFDIRVEKYQGAGETASYPVAAPPPRWSPQEPLSPLPHPSR
jgi:hypothetical protein